MINTNASQATYIYTIPHADIKKCDPSRTIKTIKNIKANNIQILVDGYNDDERDLWEILEVKKFYTKLIRDYPMIITKIHKQTTTYIRLCCSEIIGITKGNGTTHTTSIKNAEWLKAVYEVEKHLATQKR